ncbi:hypothetical protein [Sphingobium estronivorans]|nr:hypothetical protein [Sphingobium estronivorans]
MTVSINTAPISPLRQRMQHDMMMRGLGPPAIAARMVATCYMR